MQTKEVTMVEVKSTLDELNNILIAHIQKQSGAKIEKMTVDKDGVVIFSGMKSKDFTPQELMVNGAEGVDIASVLLSKGKKEKGNNGEKRSYVRKNVGLTDWLRKQLSGGEKVHVDHLVQISGGQGFEQPSRSTVVKHLKQGSLKKEMIEVNKDVFQLREAFDKIHNRNGQPAYAA